jgi:hypothetical protein
MNNPDHISESLETIFWVKIPVLKFLEADLGYGIEKNQKVRQHWCNFAVSSLVKKSYQSLGEGPASSLAAVEAGEVRYALENSASFPQLGWTTLAAPPPGSAPAAANGGGGAHSAAVKVTGADAELEEIVILGKERPTI